jgi:hypothetical protein
MFLLWEEKDQTQKSSKIYDKTDYLYEIGIITHYHQTCSSTPSVQPQAIQMPEAVPVHHTTTIPHQSHN